MNDEIKEKIKAYYIANDIDKILDYINNLQEENTKLKELCNKYEEEHKTAFKLWTQEIKKIPTYEEKLELQQKIGKAIEYITSEETINMFSSINAREKWLKINHKLLNILKGEDKE